MTAACSAEWLKLRRSRMWWISLLACTVAAGVGALFMFIGQDPARARSLGLLGTKAQLAGLVADWPSYLTLLAQIVAVGGLIVFGLVTIWIFGREFADRTVKDLLALPTSRTAIVAAKFVVLAGWCALLTVYLSGLGLLLGAGLGLDGWSPGAAARGLGRMAVTAGLVVLVCTTLALVASAGRGYLAAFGAMIAVVFTAQISAALGFGAHNPYSVPALVSGLAGPDQGSPGAVSYLLVLLAGAAGAIGTAVWWRFADQHT